MCSYQARTGHAGSIAPDPVMGVFVNPPNSGVEQDGQLHPAWKGTAQSVTPGAVPPNLRHAWFYDACSHVPAEG